jgi:hypothetical protein
MRYATDSLWCRSRSLSRTTATFVLSLVASACSSKTYATPGPTGTVCDRCGACEESIHPTSANHVPGTIDYPDPPPTGGDHNFCWATWGVHHDVVAPENWVHNLEHGGVVFLYSSRTALDSSASDAQGDAQVDAGDALPEVDALVEKLPRTLDTQYSALPKTFAVVSWGHRLVSDCVDLGAAADFYAAPFNQAPEDIPDDPPCN